MQFNFKKNILILSWIQVLHWFLLIIPVLVLFYQENGLSLSQVFLLQAVFSVGVALSEIPSGYLADILERKISLIWGSFFTAVGFSIYATFSSFWAFLIAEILMSLGAGLISGADSALIYDSLLYIKKENQYSQYEGRYLSLANFSEGMAGILGGILAFYWLRLPFVLQAVLSFVAIPPLFFLDEPPREKQGAKDTQKKISFFKNVLKEILSYNPSLRHVIFLSAAFSASTLHIVWLIQAYFKIVNLPLYLYGVVWSLLQFAAGLGAWNAWLLPRYFSVSKTLFLLMIFILVAFSLPAIFVNVFAIGFFFLAYFARGINVPILRNKIQELSDSKIRATVLSIKSTLVRILFAGLAPFAGLIADKSVTLSLLFSGVIFFLLTFFSWLIVTKEKIF